LGQPACLYPHQSIATTKALRKFVYVFRMKLL